MSEFDLQAHDITVQRVLRNASPAVLYQEALRHERGSLISASGALVALSGAKTGRSPGDKRMVRNPPSADDIWWGEVNIPIDEQIFQINRERAVDYLNTRERLFVVDAFAGWDPRYRLKVRIVCARAYHALFMHNMLIRPTPQELADFGRPDFVVYNAGEFPADTHIEGMTSKTSVDICFEDGEMVILGTQYAGEMKKGIFTVMNYLMPGRGQLSMHCSCTESRDGGDSSILFGLSGTGKTTLSADPGRLLVGDDEHVWTDHGVSNIEGGCYAKVIGLSREQEPDIFRAIRFGAVLENVVLDEETHAVDYHDTSITQNTRASYPIEHIDNARIPCTTGHPRHVIFLTCDAFGVLPPVARLDADQAMYHFISGYTAKVAGTEEGVLEPQATFSPCFGAPFLAWHPGTYARLLAQRIERHASRVWLVNTGWTGGAYGVGRRIPLAHTRAIVDAIHADALEDVPATTDPRFGFAVPTACPGVPVAILQPRATWDDPAAYDRAADDLARRFAANLQRYADGLPQTVLAAGPRG